VTGVALGEVGGGRLGGALGGRRAHRCAPRGECGCRPPPRVARCHRTRRGSRCGRGRPRAKRGARGCGRAVAREALRRRVRPALARGARRERGERRPREARVPPRRERLDVAPPLRRVARRGQPARRAGKETTQ
jgi:hypothetical protein